MTPAAFDAQMDYLARNGYTVIPLARLAALSARREPLPRKSVAITIDDGYRSTYEVAYPILSKLRLPGHGVPVQRFRRRHGRADLGADEGDAGRPA